MSHAAPLRATVAGIVGLIGAVLSMPARAQLGNELTALNQLCRMSIAAGDYEEALRVCRRVSFDIAKLAPGSPEHVTSLVNIGDVKRLVANFVDADALYQDALKLVERGPGKDGPVAQALLAQIVEVKIKRGKFLDAEVLLRRALEQRKKISAPDDPVLTQLRLRHADLQSLSHQFPEAEKNYAAVIAILARGGQPMAELHRVALQHLAETLERQQKYQRAELGYLDLLSAIESAPPSPDARLSLPQVLGRIGFVVEQQGRQREAARYYARELTLLKTSGAAPDVIANLEARLSTLTASPSSPQEPN